MDKKRIPLGQLFHWLTFREVRKVISPHPLMSEFEMRINFSTAFGGLSLPTQGYLWYILFVINVQPQRLTKWTEQRGNELGWDNSGLELAHIPITETDPGRDPTPKRGGGNPRSLYGPQICYTEQCALSAPQAPKILF